MDIVGLVLSWSFLVQAAGKILKKLKQTLITYNVVEELWVLNVPGTNVTGRSRAAHASFTLGKHNWTIEGDKGCSGGEEYVTELKMSGCQDGHYTCSDGQCVSMELRCCVVQSNFTTPVVRSVLATVK